MSNEVDAEVRLMSERLQKIHGEKVASAAVLIAFSTSLFAKMPASMVEMHRECMEMWIKSKGLDPMKVAPAVLGVQQVIGTMNYLESLPA